MNNPTNEHYIETPEGWTTMGELKPGSMVLGRDGKPTRVVYTSPVDTNGNRVHTIERNSRWATDFRAVDGGGWNILFDYCTAYGHAAYRVDGEQQDHCPRCGVPNVIVTETSYGVSVECDSDSIALRECAKYEQGGYAVSLVAGMGDSYVFDVYMDR